MLSGSFRAHAENLPVHRIYASVVHGIDGIGITFDHVGEMIETVHGFINFDLFTVHVNEVAAVYGVGDANVGIVQRLC